MHYETYQQLFQQILDSAAPPPPYNDPHYMNYVKLNWSRQQRWLKTGILDAELVEAITRINVPLFWTVITEPWCGDAAHSLPFLHKIAILNPLITVDYQLRDKAPFLIDQYLTNGKKSIPKLIIQNKDKQDLAIWGPRPLECQALFDRLRKNRTDADQVKIELQNWYNDDKGASFQRELLILINDILAAQAPQSVAS